MSTVYTKLPAMTPEERLLHYKSAEPTRKRPATSNDLPSPKRSFQPSTTASPPRPAVCTSTPHDAAVMKVKRPKKVRLQQSSPDVTDYRQPRDDGTSISIGDQASGEEDRPTPNVDDQWREIGLEIDNMAVTIVISEALACMSKELKRLSQDIFDHLPTLLEKSHSDRQGLQNIWKAIMEQKVTSDFTLKRFL